jgi:hypothetical protein
MRCLCSFEAVQAFADGCVEGRYVGASTAEAVDGILSEAAEGLQDGVLIGREDRSSLGVTWQCGLHTINETF